MQRVLSNERSCVAYGCPHIKYGFPYKPLNCMSMQRTLHLRGGSFGASPCSNKEEHGREEHGQILAKFSCFLPLYSCAGQDVNLSAPKPDKNEFKMAIHQLCGTSIKVWLELLSLSSTRSLRTS